MIMRVREWNAVKEKQQVHRTIMVEA